MINYEKLHINIANIFLYIAGTEGQITAGFINLDSCQETYAKHCGSVDYSHYCASELWLVEIYLFQQPKCKRKISSILTDCHGHVCQL